MVELKEDFKPWNEPGTHLAGYLGPREKIPVGSDGQTSWKRQMKTEEGEVLTFLSPDWSLESLLSKIAEGTFVEIKYEGESQTGSGNMKKDFKVWLEQIPTDG